MTKIIEIDSETAQKLFGTLDRNVRIIEDKLKVKVRLEGGALKIESGDEKIVDQTATLIETLIVLIKRGYDVDENRVETGVALAKEDKTEEILALATDTIAITAKGKHIKCKTVGQRYYVNEIKHNTLTFGIGPAGTGKTYLAVAMAVSAYKSGQVQKIILTRPAIEAGEKLGFLPGDLQDKVDPYLRPLYDALSEMFGTDHYNRLMERGIIEIAPLAYMRGRTLSDAFIILDEAQNATSEQMKMFLTRFGDGSKVVVTGDVTQIDLPHSAKSGLIEASKILKDTEDVAVCFLTDRDVVRNKLVQKIILAYSNLEKKDEFEERS
ncbi:MAG: PhoH family protein [Clostridia bacterium]|nr:PhoH family protein [Clostridia bacterium]